MENSLLWLFSIPRTGLYNLSKNNININLLKLTKTVYHVQNWEHKIIIFSNMYDNPFSLVYMPWINQSNS